MNCKPGDLAIVVRSVAGNEGKIVRCLAVIPTGTLLKGYTTAGIGWLTDIPLNQCLENRNGTYVRADYLPFALHSFLSPIRDQDGEDEMIRIAGKPKTKEHSR